MRRAHQLVLAVVFVLSALSFSCVASANAGEQLCAKHHQALRSMTVFGPAAGVCVLFQPSKRMARQLAHSPNALPLDLQRKPNLLYSRAVQVWYCLRCEEEVEMERQKPEGRIKK
jgi:hypothetical protein